MQELQIGPNDAGQRMDKYLKKALPGAPMGLLFKQLRNKNITLNRKKAQGNEILKLGDVIQCFFSQDTFEQFQGLSQNETKKNEYAHAYQTINSTQKIEVLYEDANVLLINKPVGILSQKAAPGDISINEWMIGYLMAQNALKESDLATFTPSVVNRIDRNTSGILICGKSLAGLQACSKMLRDRSIGKFYRTICHGKIQAPREVSGYLLKDEKTNQVKIFEKPYDNADEIRTKYVPLTATKDYTLLEVELITGKPHQIRAHLASLGHPILGDAKYARSLEAAEDKKNFHLSYQLLHCYRVEFPKWETIREEYGNYESVLRPLSGKEVVAPLPKQFTTIQDRIFV